MTRITVWFKGLQDRIGTTRDAALQASHCQLVSPPRDEWCHQLQGPRLAPGFLQQAQKKNRKEIPMRPDRSSAAVAAKNTSLKVAIMGLVGLVVLVAGLLLS